jgi:tol-pal system protein YbgF
MIFGEEYNMLPGGRRISPNAVAGQKPAPGASATAAAPVQPAQPPMGQAVQPRPAQTPPSPPAQTASSDKAAYASALALYEKSQLAAAEKAFSGFLQQYPQSPLVPNAMYWLGECYYSTDRMDNAIMIFKDVAGKFPKHDKAAASLLKAGYAYAKLGDMENAYFYWQILLDDFPGSAPANLARKRMAGR